MAACPGESQKYGRELCWGLGYGVEELVNIHIIHLHLDELESVSAWDYDGDMLLGIDLLN